MIRGRIMYAPLPIALYTCVVYLLAHTRTRIPSRRTRKERHTESITEIRWPAINPTRKICYLFRYYFYLHLTDADNAIAPFFY